MKRVIEIFALSALSFLGVALAQEVTSSNAEEHAYEVRVDVPDEVEPQFKRLNIQFPGSIDEYVYAYSSIVYAREGKRILSYRPEAFSRSALSDRRELYVLAHEDVLPCMSFVNIYQDRSQGEIHSPSRYVTVNLASFISSAPQECEGSVDATNFH
jgi:hypothetical protein